VPEVPASGESSSRDAFAPTARTRVRRIPARGAYDRATIFGILDEGLVAHVAFVAEDRPYAIPMSYGCVGDDLFLHGSAASRLLRTLASGAPVCVTVTLLDGLVVARSAFHHSMNYRSAVVLGRGEEVRDEGERLAALRAIVERHFPGRWDEARRPNEPELRATLVVRVRIEEASAKVRTGPPKDDPEDLDLAAWAGVVPIRQVEDPPIPDPTLRAGIAVSRSVLRRREARRSRIEGPGD
jgi:hypothetical protein